MEYTFKSATSLVFASKSCCNFVTSTLLSSTFPLVAASPALASAGVPGGGGVVLVEVACEVVEFHLDSTVAFRHCEGVASRAFDLEIGSRGVESDREMGDEDDGVSGM